MKVISSGARISATTSRWWRERSSAILTCRERSFGCQWFTARAMHSTACSRTSCGWTTGGRAPCSTKGSPRKCVIAVMNEIGNS